MSTERCAVYYDHVAIRRRMADFLGGVRAHGICRRYSLVPLDPLRHESSGCAFCLRCVCNRLWIFTAFPFYHSARTPMNALNLVPGEIIVIHIRKHWFVLLRDTIGSILAGILPFALFLFLPSSLKELIPAPIPVSEIGLFVSILWILVVWLALCVLWTHYYLDLWVVTDRRIVSIDQVGLFNRIVSTWSLDHIQELTIKENNIFESLLSFGTIEVETASPDDEHERINGIPHPERVRTKILELMHAAHARRNVEK